mgnify:FL=1
MKWFNRKSNLDEMQELQLLKAESRGFWIGFIGLAVAMAIQAFLYDAESMGDMMSGEFIVFLCMGLYLIGSCLRNGIWDRHLKATPAVNIGLSLLAAAVTALFNAILSYRNYHDAFTALIVFAVYFLMLSVVLSVTLTVCSALYRRKRRKLEEEDSDEKN